MKITPLWPQSNHSETFMKPLLKAVKTSHTEGKNWCDELFHFLLNYRTTPHTIMNVASADLTKLPQLNQQLQNEPLLDPFVDSSICMSISCPMLIILISHCLS